MNPKESTANASTVVQDCVDTGGVNPQTIVHHHHFPPTRAVQAGSLPPRPLSPYASQSADWQPVCGPLHVDSHSFLEASCLAWHRDGRGSARPRHGLLHAIHGGWGGPPHGPGGYRRSTARAPRGEGRHECVFFSNFEPSCSSWRPIPLADVVAGSHVVSFQTSEHGCSTGINFAEKRPICLQSWFGTLTATTVAHRHSR